MWYTQGDKSTGQVTQSRRVVEIALPAWVLATPDLWRAEEAPPLRGAGGARGNGNYFAPVSTRNSPAAEISAAHTVTPTYTQKKNFPSLLASRQWIVLSYSCTCLPKRQCLRTKNQMLTLRHGQTPQIEALCYCSVSVDHAAESLSCRYRKPTTLNTKRLKNITCNLLIDT